MKDKVPSGYHPRFQEVELNLDGKSKPCDTCGNRTTHLIGYEKTFPGDEDLWICQECNVEYRNNGHSVLASVPRKNKNSPVRPYRTILDRNGNSFLNRIMIGTPCTGLLRVEWVSARYGQILPMNWSYVYATQLINAYMPLQYQVADAQNVLVRHAIMQQIEWLLLLEHDVILPPNTFLKLNEYMIKEEVPVVSGLYFNRDRPSAPLAFRGRGNGFYANFEIGERIWVDGVPTGILLIHMGIIRKMWDESEEYKLGDMIVRRIFEAPNYSWSDPENPFNDAQFGGTSDLNWCTRVMEGNYFEKAGWPEYQKKQYPFLIDTSIFCKHINPDGEMFP